MVGPVVVSVDWDWIGHGDRRAGYIGIIDRDIRRGQAGRIHIVLVSKAERVDAGTQHVRTRRHAFDGERSGSRDAGSQRVTAAVLVAQPDIYLTGLRSGVAHRAGDFVCQGGHKVQTGDRAAVHRDGQGTRREDGVRSRDGRSEGVGAIGHTREGIVSAGVAGDGGGRVGVEGESNGGDRGEPAALPSVICPLTGNPAPGACTGMVNVPLAWVRDASVTDTEKEAVPVAVGLPETVPLEKLSPTAERLGRPT